MKKIFIAAVMWILVLSAAASAQELTFIPEGGGKYIFSNNEEGITENYLMEGDHPSYLMNNLNLTPDRYYFYGSHFNYVTADGNQKDSYNIEVDVEMTAKEDTVIELLRTGFSTSKAQTYYDTDGIKRKEEEHWMLISACSQMMGQPIYVKDYPIIYETKEQVPQIIKIKKGETVWLSQYLENYDSVYYLKPVHMQAEFNILSGRMDFNLAAFRSREKLGDRSSFTRDASFGTYKYTRMQKGVADSLPKVNTQLEFTINDEMKNGEEFPVTVRNQFQPEGNTVTQWCTNLNPQDDIWSYNIAAENDLLTLKYYDPSKLDYYGKNVPEEEKTPYWIFDPKHSDTTYYQNLVKDIDPDDYAPNYLLSEKPENFGKACSMGNYGVATTYNLTVTNEGKRDRHFQYLVSEGSIVIVAVKDENGKLIKPLMTKMNSEGQNMEPMADILIPAGETKKFSVEVTLPVNCFGGVRNAFSVQDTEAVFSFPRTFKQMEVREKHDTGYDTLKLLEKSNEKTKAVFEGNYDSYDIKKQKNGYMARWKCWDALPHYHQANWSFITQVYFLDQKFNIIRTSRFNSLPIDSSLCKERCYVSTVRDANFVSADNGITWKPWGYSRLPVDNGGVFGAIKNNSGEIAVSQDGDQFIRVTRQAQEGYTPPVPPYIEEYAGLYYCVWENLFMYSTDGVYWHDIWFEEDVTSFEYVDGTLRVWSEKEQKEIKITKEQSPVFVRVKDRFLGFDAMPVIENDRTLVPMRYIFEVLGMQVSWDETAKTAVGSKDGIQIAFVTDSNIAYVNGTAVQMDVAAKQYNWRTMIPLRFLSESLGYTVQWDQENRIAAIDEAPNRS